MESPVVGSRVPALEGQLIILAAGERKLYDECYSCFEAIGKKSLYLGLFCIYFYKCFNVSDICFKEIKSCLPFCLLNRSRHRSRHQDEADCQHGDGDRGRWTGRGHGHGRKSRTRPGRRGRGSLSGCPLVSNSHSQKSG